MIGKTVRVKVPGVNKVDGKVVEAFSDFVTISLGGRRVSISKRYIMYFEVLD